MRILLSNVTGFVNRGVEAFTLLTIRKLWELNKNLEFIVASTNADYDRQIMEAQGFDVQCMSFKEAVMKNRDIKGAIVLGGDVFSSCYGVKSLKRNLRYLKALRFLGKPFILSAHSIGRFSEKKQADMFCKIAGHARLITARESDSYEYLLGELEFSAEKVARVADPAFLLEDPDPKVVEKILISYGLETDKPFVCIAPSQGISGFTSINKQEHAEAWYSLLKYLLDGLNLQVLMIPHCKESHWNNNDAYLDTYLLRQMNYHPRLKLAGLEHQASEFKGLIKASEMLVTERMHAGIAALASGVCPVVIKYSIKAEGIMRDFFKDQAESKGLLISTQDFLQKDITEQIGKVWQKRHDYSEQIRSKHKEVYSLAESNFDLLDGVLKNL